VLRIRRAAVEAAMTRAGVASPARAARSMYAGLGTGIFELLWLAARSPTQREEALCEHVVLDADLDRALREAAERGPVILAASHTANWELIAYGAARVLGTRGSRLAVVVKPLSVGVFHAFCMSLRRACGVVLIAPEGALRTARKSLAAGDVLAMPIDQVPDRTQHGVHVSFLGAPALADRAPATLARATGATLLVVAASRDGRVQRGHLLAELRPDATRAANAWIMHATREGTRALEAFVSAHPASWLWLHRRWRAPRARRARRARAERSARGASSLVATRHPG
jgi:Kdo2-lipid IVA lauroyltransferase/acyltransferase